MFEQLKIEEELTNQETSDSSNTTATLDRKQAKNFNEQQRKNQPISNDVANNVNDLLSDPPDEQNDINCKYLRKQMSETKVFDKRRISNSRQSNSSNETGNEEKLVDWNCMEKFDNLIEIEIKNLTSSHNHTANSSNSKNETLPSPSTSSLSSYSIISSPSSSLIFSTTSTSSSSNCSSNSAVNSFTSKKNIVDNDNNNNNILKLEKHVSEY